LIFVAGIYTYKKQADERKARIKQTSATIGNALLKAAEAASAQIQQAEEQLSALAIPGPERRTGAAAVIRELAKSTESLSAQQLFERMTSPPLPVTEIRALFYSQPHTFVRVRRGGFTLGQRGYWLTVPDAVA